MIRKTTKLISVAMIAVLVLTACGAKGEVSDNKADGGADAGDSVELHFVQDVLQDEESNNYFESLVDDYNEMTGHKITFESIDDQFRTWLTTQFTADSGPDIYTANLYDATADFGKGWLYNFAEEVKEENPYYPGQPWGDTISDILMDRMYLSSDEVAGVPSTTVVVRLYYNMDMFEEAGIDSPPQTWPEFVEVMEKLQDAGHVPLAFPNSSIEDLSWLWFNNSITNQITQSYMEELDVDGNGFIELNEMARGVDEGIIDFNNPEFEYTFELMKEFSQYWAQDYNALDQKTAIQMFLRGDVAMVQAGSWDLKMIDEIEGRDFEYGVFPVPAITSDMHPEAIGKSVVLGGQPDGIYCVNKNLTGKELEVAIDFVHYMTSPDVQAKKAAEIYQIPSSVEAPLPEKLSGFVITEEDLRIPYFTGINEEARNYFHRGGQEYLQDEITVEEYGDIINEAYVDILDTIKQENGWTKENNYKIGE